MNGFQTTALRGRVFLFVAALLLAGLVLWPEHSMATTPPANDAFEDAIIIRGDSASVVGNNEFATREKGEADHILSGSSLGEASVWYRWTAWRSGMTRADICKSGFDTVLAVYARDDEGDLEQVADNDDGCSSRNHRGSSLTFEAKFQETYWISVSGYSESSTGNFVLSLSSVNRQ
ncbi:MAG: hypothetical protein ACRDSJ_07500 [Rubrobacteraceae bacterium]